MLQRLIKSTTLKYGIVVSIALIAYFILLSFFDKHTSPLFSVFNSFIIGFGIYKAINFIKLNQGRNFEYSSGFKVGLFTGFLATIIHGLFFTLYITNVNLNFPKVLLDSSTNNELFNNTALFKTGYIETLSSFIEYEMPAIVGLFGFLVILILGFSTSIILTYLCMEFIGNKTIEYA